MDTETDIDLEELYSVGDEAEKHCEHSQHKTDPYFHSDDSGLTYVQVWGCWTGQVFMFCNEFLDLAMTGDPRCNKCAEPLKDHYKIIGPAL